MLRNYLVIAVRNFLRQGLYSVINVGGLSAGLVCVLLIYLWVNDEVQKDKFHKDADRIVRVISSLDPGDGNILSWTHTPGPLSEDVRQNIPQVELATRTISTGGQLFQFGENNVLGDGIYADPEFFSLFSFDIRSGVAMPIGNDKASLAISEAFAERLFGREDPIGKVVRYQSKYDLEVKAVFKNIGTESSIKFAYVLPMEIFKEIRGNGFNWGNFDHPLYLKLTDPEKREEVARIMTERRAPFREEFGNVVFSLQPFTDKHLYSQFENGVPVGGRIKYVRLFTIVAVFVLIVACINFMNMATAKAVARTKEVGVRKVVGAQRHALIAQFLVESMATVLLSMLIAVGFVYATLPLFNTLIAKDIQVNFLGSEFLLAGAAIVVITGLLAGSYPAFFLSAFRPAAVLKGTLSAAVGGVSFRKGLVVFQFTLTVILGVSALVVFRQVDYIRNKNLGYDRNGVLMFQNRIKTFDAFKTEALQLPGVQTVTRADHSPVSVNNQNGSVEWPGKPEKSAVFFRTVCVDYDYLETMGFKLQEGRFFSPEFADSNNFVVTRRSVDIMGLANPVGQKIKQWDIEGTIVGVVDDFHSQSMQQAIDPIVFMHRPKWSWRIFVRFDTEQTAAVVPALTSLLKKYNPEYPFEFSFLDDDFERLYNNEKVISSLANVFGLLTMIISGLGLFGLAAYTAERRRKEIGIRKTLGATVTTLVSMMSREFVKLTAIACVIGCPLAYYLMSRFLESYTYHPEITWDIFLITIVATLLLAVFTVIFQVAKAAVASPVESLRTE